MGAALGLAFGIGVLLLVVRPNLVRSAPRRSRCAALLQDAGLPGVRPGQLIVATTGASAIVGALVFAVSQAFPVAVAFALFAALAPRAFLVRRARARALARRDAWPDAVDHVVSAVRAGLSLPEALSELGASGPAELRPAFGRFGVRYQATGAFGRCLDELADDLADPVGDRVVEALRVAREVGGSDLGLVLRTLSRFLREDARTRGEIEARQSWTVNAARVALAAPWLVLLILATQSTTIQAYNSAPGAVVLVVGGGVSYAAFLVMRRIGRLPEERRVLR